MKKILNAPSAYVDEMLAGLCTAYPSSYKLAGARVLTRAGGAVPGKVGIVTGGGSGHLPVFLGYVGDGLLDACAVGNVFAGPRVADCVSSFQAADGGAGVLALYGNYGGDRMNFEMAMEALESDTFKCAAVRVADDVASASTAERTKRRGVAGMVFAFKIAGACAAAGGSLSEVTAAAQKAAHASATDRAQSAAVRTGPEAAHTKDKSVTRAVFHAPMFALKADAE
jgi:dihydroxyacetone kinase-like protein